MTVTKFKRLAAVGLCLLCMMTLLPLYAAAEAFDSNKPLSLTVNYMDGESPVVGALFRLYKVASMNDDLTLKADSTFASHKSSIEDPEIRWDVLADTLQKFVEQKKLNPDDEAETNAAGKASFPSGTKALTPGVYLLISSRHRYNGRIYDPSPVIVTLPNQDVYGQWDYNVDIHAKFTPDEDIPIDIIVQKKWDDSGHSSSRPKSISVVLLRDGKEFERKNLNKDNNWTYTWTGLDPIYTWEIREVKVTGYDSSIKVDKDDHIWTVTITNHYEPPPPSKLPQTGQLNWPVPVLLVSGAILLCLGCILRLGSKKDDYA